MNGRLGPGRLVIELGKGGTLDPTVAVVTEGPSPSVSQWGGRGRRGSCDASGEGGDTISAIAERQS